MMTNNVDYNKKYYEANKEKIKKQIEYRKLHPLSEEEKRKPLSKKHKEKISIALKGKMPKFIPSRKGSKCPEKLYPNAGMRGKRHSLESKRRMSKSHSGICINDEWKMKISKSLKGRKGTILTEKERKSIGEKVRLFYKNSSKDFREKRNEKISKALRNNDKAKWGNIKRGYFDINGEKIFFRSKWEANYALYLDFLIKQKQIKKWEYEKDVFVFEKIKFGVRSYRPDFKVYNIDGSIEYHEVKGWMTSRSKTKLKRMAKYYPNIRLILIDQKYYHDIKNKVGKMLCFY